MKLELDKEQIEGIVWLMEDKISQPVMALPQFANMRLALAYLKQCVAGPSAQHRAECDCPELRGGKCTYPLCDHARG